MGTISLQRYGLFAPLLFLSVGKRVTSLLRRTKISFALEVGRYQRRIRRNPRLEVQIRAEVDDIVLFRSLKTFSLLRHGRKRRRWPGKGRNQARTPPGLGRYNAPSEMFGVLATSVADNDDGDEDYDGGCPSDATTTAGCLIGVMRV